MADVITKLKLETTQFDSKLRDSAQSLTDLTHHLSLAGKDFDRFAQKHVEAAKAFGETASGATNLKDKLKDLVSAYNKVANAYNALTEEQKKTDFGKAMAESLNKLQGQIRETKNELNAVPGIFDQLASKLTVNIDAMKLFEVGLKAGSAALGVAKDAFFASEANIDEWGRIVASSTSLYEGFLTAINTGDISGYLNNISQIVTAAREAYDELDKLGTMQTIQAPQKSGQQKEIERMRLMLRTGVWIDKGDGSTNQWGLKQGDRLNKDQLKIIEWHLKRGVESSTKLIEREVKQATKSINALYNKEAKNLGLSLEEFRKGTISWEEFNKRIEGYQRYKEFEEKHTTYALTSDGNGEYSYQPYRDNAVNPNAQYAKWGVFKDDSASYKQLVQLILQRDQWDQQRMQMVGQAYQTMNRLNGITPRNLLKGAGGSGSGNGPIGNTTQQLTPLQEVQKRITDLSNEALTADKERQDAIKKEIEGLNVQVKLYKDIQDYVNGITKEAKVPEMATGFAGLSNASLSAWTNGLKQQLDQAELGSALYQSLSEQLADTTAISNLISTAIKQGLDLSAVGLGAGEIEGFWSSILSAENITDEQLQEIVNKMNQFMGDHPIKLNVKTGEVSVETPKRGEKSGGEAHVLSEVGKMTSGISSIVSGIESLGVKIPDGLKAVISGIQGVMSILTGISSMITAIQTLSAASSFRFFAGGGVVHAAGGYIVPGNYFSGDMVPAMLNSGEVVLNRAQAGVIASELQGGAQPAISSTPYVTGEQIYLGLSNYLRRIGRGELLTARG